MSKFQKEKDCGYKATPVMYFSHNLTGRHNITTGCTELEGVVNIERSKINSTKCCLSHVSGPTSKFASDEVKAYAQNIIDCTDTHTADGKPYPTDAEIKANLTDKVNYAANAEKLFDTPSALCGDGCIRTCMAHLEKTGKLTHKFHSRFRE